MENKTILSARKLTKTYGPNTVLDHVSIDFREGEIHALIGENGAGKSTLCKILSGAIDPSSGSVAICGREFSSLTPAVAKEQGIGMVYQEFNLMPELTIYENLFVGKELKKGIFIDNRAMLKQSTEFFENMGIKVDCSQRIKDISVAYCQLVEIAKALLENSRILILDEPTAPLTKSEIELLFKVLNRLKQKGICMIYISHRLNEVFQLCDRITVLRDGQFIKTMDVGETSMEELIHLMIGREMSCEFPPRDGDYDYNGAETILKAEKLRNKTLKDVSFELKKGEILGIAGLVGAGRSEVVRAIFGADRLQSGTITVNGDMVRIKSPQSAIKKGIALIPEDRKREGLMPILSIGTNISIVVIGKLKRLLLISKKREKELLDSKVKLLSIKAPSLRNPVSDLSGGNQQKVVLAKWLSTTADILIFDEPTRGIDIGAKKEIYEFLFALKREGKSMIVISSEMSEMLNLCDRMIIMHEGSKVGELLYQEATQDKVLTMASGIGAGLETEI